MLRSTIFVAVVCGFEGVPQCKEVRFVAVVVVSKCCPSAEKYDLLPLSVVVVLKWCPSAKKYDLLPLFVVSKWCPSAKKYDLLPLFVGFEVVPQC